MYQQFKYTTFNSVFIEIITDDISAQSKCKQSKFEK